VYSRVTESEALTDPFSRQPRQAPELLREQARIAKTFILQTVKEAGEDGLNEDELFQATRQVVREQTGEDYWWATYDAQLYWMSADSEADG
jgi:hypothetical protein